MEGNLHGYIGDFDVQEGSITDRATGEKMTYREWQLYTEDGLVEQMEPFVENRDIRRDDQNIFGNKPHFHDDRFNNFPSQVKQTGMYPLELGFRSPYLEGESNPIDGL